MNKTPEILAPFRRGSFAQAVKYEAPIYGLAISGCADCWPLKAKVGGYPSTIRVKLQKLMVPTADADVASVAEECHRMMQKQVDVLRHMGGKRAKRAEAYPVVKED